MEGRGIKLSQKVCEIWHGRDYGEMFKRLWQKERRGRGKKDYGGGWHYDRRSEEIMNRQTFHFKGRMRNRGEGGGVKEKREEP